MGTHGLRPERAARPELGLPLGPRQGTFAFRLQPVPPDPTGSRPWSTRVSPLRPAQGRGAAGRAELGSGEERETAAGTRVASVPSKHKERPAIRDTAMETRQQDGEGPGLVPEPSRLPLLRSPLVLSGMITKPGPHSGGPVRWSSGKAGARPPRPPLQSTASGF